MSEDTKWLILGAGMAGLTLGRELLGRGEKPVILEKSRGVGGRMATRRWEGGVFDHGAQFFTVRSPEFGERVAVWEKEAQVRSWFDHASWEGSVQREQVAGSVVGGHPRYVGVRGMTTVPKLLAEGLDIRKQTLVTSVERREGGSWWVKSDSGKGWKARHLVVTAPLPQALALLDPVEGFRERAGVDVLAEVDYHPCLAFLLRFSEDPGVLPPGAIKCGEEPIAWIGDNYAKGISTTPAVTIHSTPAFAKQYWDAPDEVRIPAMVNQVKGLFRMEPTRVACHRWRYGEMIRGAGVGSFWDAKWRLGLCGDGFTGGRVEGAFLSALDLFRRSG